MPSWSWNLCASKSVPGSTCQRASYLEGCASERDAFWIGRRAGGKEQHQIQHSTIPARRGDHEEKMPLALPLTRRKSGGQQRPPPLTLACTALLVAVREGLTHLHFTELVPSSNATTP